LPIVGASSAACNRQGAAPVRGKDILEQPLFCIVTGRVFCHYQLVADDSLKLQNPETNWGQIACFPRQGLHRLLAMTPPQISASLSTSICENEVKNNA
jgi:hypothetical protein